jgi:hypothetical protein
MQSVTVIRYHDDHFPPASRLFCPIAVFLISLGLAVWDGLRRRQYADRKRPPVNRPAFMTGFVWGAILGLIFLPVEMFCLFGASGIDFKDGPAVFSLLFLASFLAAVHAFGWGFSYAGKILTQRSRRTALAIVS